MAFYRIIQSLQAEENFVCLVLVAEPWRLEWLNEVDVEVALWLGRRPIIGRTEEEVAVPVNAPIFMEPEKYLPAEYPAIPGIMPAAIGAISALEIVLPKNIIGIAIRNDALGFQKSPA